MVNEAKKGQCRSHSCGDGKGARVGRRDPGEGD